MTKTKSLHMHRFSGQRGLVLFIALVALVAMSLAGVALMRSVDTSTLIAGNLAFRQAATSSGDSGPEGGIAWLTTTNAANSSIDPWIASTHPLNINNPAVGYYSNVGGFDLFAESTWSTASSAPGTGANFDSTGLDTTTGNTVRYVIERMCRTANQVLSEANCLFSDTSEDNRRKNVESDPEVRSGFGDAAGSPVYRITARITGPKNTVSYIQTYTY